MSARRLADLVPPLVFGLAVLAFWEARSAAVCICRRSSCRRPPRSGFGSRIPADARCRLLADDPGRARRLRRRLRLGARRRHSGRPLALPAARPAADRQFGVGAADRRHRADHGDVVRLRLAVEGRGRRRDDLLSDAGERGRGPRQRRRDGARPDEDLRRRLLADPACAEAAGRAAVRVQRAEDQHDARA